MLRISELPATNGAATLRLEGRLVGPWVAEAGQLCDRLLDGLSALKLDLMDLSYLDRNGALLLAQLRTRGVPLVNCSPFIQEQLKALAQV